MINFYSYYNGILDKPRITNMFATFWYCLATGIRCPEHEMRIIKNPIRGYTYARYIIKGRWVEAEPYIMKDSYYACYYAIHVMKERWVEMEPTIKRDAWLWDEYCLEFWVC